MRWIPDWLIYLVLLCTVVLILFRMDERAPAPEWQAQDLPGAGETLPPPSVFDSEVLVEVGPATPGLGTAFAVSREGYWMTARHVVADCTHVAVLVGGGRALPAEETLEARFADLALIRTAPLPRALALALVENDLAIGQQAFHIGYPQGRPGETASQLAGRERLIARGRYSLEEPVLAWAERGRTDGLRGSLAGLSGGPALNADGAVIGVTIAESPRRGRIYTAAPSTILRWFEVARVVPDGGVSPRINARNYGQRADQLRRDMLVRPVVCDTGRPPGDVPAPDAAEEPAPEPAAQP
jgi:hypothetical protein